VRQFVTTLVVSLLLPCVTVKFVYALSPNQRNVAPKKEFCLQEGSGQENSHSSFLKSKLQRSNLTDPVKIEALSQALSIACRSEWIDLSQSAKYIRLKELLRIGREQYESTGFISNTTLRLLEQEVGVTKTEVQNSHKQNMAWQLTIDKKAKAEMRIKTAASVASSGYLLIEAYHQLSNVRDFEAERGVILNAIEKMANAILDNPDENNDGRFGWGRVWFKGKDGLLLHTSLPGQNMYFGGYTYFPRADSAGQPTCESSLPLKEEAFDHAHNALFLLEAFLVTRDKSLGKRILLTVGKAFDDTFDEGGIHKQLGEQGWYYWKSLGKQRLKRLEECEVGREIKNTNLRMGLALLAFAEILMHNREALRKGPDSSFDHLKYLARATQVIRTNNYEILELNNFGYQGVSSRDVELGQEPNSKLLVYDRTQTTIGLDDDVVGDLKDVIIAGNKVFKRSTPATVTMCGGSASDHVINRDIAGSCWNHLAFETEDYYRIARFLNVWNGNDEVTLREYLELVTRNLAAAKILHDGRESRYAHYFPYSAEKAVSNEVVNSTFYGFFCMARNLQRHRSAADLSSAHRKLLLDFGKICKDIPSEATGVTWRKGNKFYELYLAAERFDIPDANWLLTNKK
jgi:hypothetical protein